MNITTEASLTGGMYDSTRVVDTVNGFPVGDKAISCAFIASMISSLIGDGVIDTGNGDLSVVPAGGLAIRVKEGTAWACGYMARLDGTLTAELTAGHEYTVFVRQDYALGEATVCICEDNDGTIPVRRTGTHDLVLARVKIPAGALTVSEAMITDYRADSSKCGFVTSRLATA